MTRRLRLDLRYDGSWFHGWARQEGLRTIQGELEAALSTIFQVPITTTVAGRTDAGVHATAQVAHTDIPDALVASMLSGTGDQRAFRTRLNSLLSAQYSRWRQPLVDSGLIPRSLVSKGHSDLVLNRVTEVDRNFDARFSALKRHYEYKIADSTLAKNPIARFDQWWTPAHALNLETMNEAARHLIGEHDFLSFCKPRPNATTVRRLSTAAAKRTQDGVLSIAATGDAFCHSMVRALVGALVEVGRGAKEPRWVLELVQDPGRHHGVPVAPARGLTLIGVDYPDPSRWAAQASLARTLRGSTK